MCRTHKTLPGFTAATAAACVYVATSQEFVQYFHGEIATYISVKAYDTL